MFKSKWKLIPVLVMLFVVNTVFAQTTKIDLSIKNGTLKQFIALIEEKTNYTFVLDLTIDQKIAVNIDVRQAELGSVLKKVLNKNKIGYEVMGRQIILKQLPVGNPGSHSKTKKITGIVKDNNNEPIIGANVVEKGTTNGIITDMDGRFALEIPEDAVIRISYIGYNTQDLSVMNKTVLAVILTEDSKALEEVVVVGYGTQKKVNLTGSVSAISSADIKDRVQTNVLSAVQGTVPGVTVISRPGSAPSINFRGRGNLGTSEPLYVIDGAIADASFFSNLDPNSIESISFLKDAASSAIYGSRAAYGVVLVTTKSGDSKKMNVSYNGHVGINMPTYIPKSVNSWQYAEMRNEGSYNRDPSKGKFQIYSADEIGWFRDGSKPDFYPNTKWTDLVLDKEVVTTQHSIDFSGGNEKVRYFVGLGYLYNDNFMPGKNDDRYNINMNLTSDLTKWLTLKARAKYIRNSSESQNAVPFLPQVSSVPAIMVARQSNGEWGSYAAGKQAQQTWINNNPLRILSREDWSKGKSDNTMFDLGFDLKPVKGLVVSGQAVYKGYENKTKSYKALQDNVKNFETGAEIPGTGKYQNSMSMEWSSSTRMLYTGTIKYDWSNTEHAIGLLAGTSYEYYKLEKLSGSRKNFPVEGIQDMNGGSSTGVDISNGAGSSENKMLSYFARVNYNFSDRYLLEANIRSDASSRFHKSNRTGIFPSFSAGWRINEEGFMNNISWIDNLKLRASWGSLGNINNVGDYDYFQNYNSEANYTFDDQAVQGILESKPANIGLGWETVTLTNIGVDLDVLSSKFSLTAEYYIKNTKDILLGYNVPKEIGIANAPSQNIGKVLNKGFELFLTYRDHIGDLSYSLRGNIATNKNEIRDLGNSDNIIQNGGDKIRYILKKGEAVGSYYGYKTDGLYTQSEIDAGHYYTFGRKPNAGDVKYVPQRDNVEWGSPITGEDRAVIGKDVPDITYGINLNLNYKNFELSVFGQGVIGTKVAFEVDQVTPFSSGNSPKEFHLGRWTQENPNPQASSPRLYGGHSMDDYNQYFSEFNLFDADYFRIKTISLGYMIPQNVINKWSISALKLFVTTENLFTIRADHKMKDFDPEDGSGRGLAALGTKSVAFGVNLSF